MMLPSEEKLRLREIIRNGTEEEVLKAYEELEKLVKKETEERKKNPPPWGNLML